MHDMQGLTASFATTVMVAMATSAASAFAHHGVAPHYDTSKPVRIEGVVSRFDFINPHSFVYIETSGAGETTGAGGGKQIWSCEMASRTVLSRNGLTAKSFAPGERIVIEGVAARHKGTGCALRVAHFADGRVLQS